MKRKMFSLHPWQLFMIGLTFVSCAFSTCTLQQRKGFIEGKESEFNVKYHPKRKGISFTDADIEWDPKAMLDDALCYDLKNVTLKYLAHSNSLTDNGDSTTNSNDVQQNWNKAVSETYKTIGRKQKWLKVKVVPCYKYDFKIVVQSNGQKEETFESSPKHLKPVDKETIENSLYDPEMPEFVSEQSVGSKTKLKFMASPCVDTYELFIRELNGDDNSAGQKGKYSGDGNYEDISSDNKTLTIEKTDLKPCTEYETMLTALINGRMNEGEDLHTIITNPDEQTAENIELRDFQIGTDSVSFSFDSPWKPKLSCIQAYQIQICPDQECLDSSIVNRSAENPTYDTIRKDLTPCTDYELKITPLYQDVTIQPKSFPFKTLSYTNSACPIVQTNEIEQTTDTPKQQDTTSESESADTSTAEKGSGSIDPRIGDTSGNESTVNSGVTQSDGKNENQGRSQPKEKSGNMGVIVAVIFIALGVVGGVVGYLVYKKKGKEYDPVELKVEPTKEAAKDIEAGNENTRVQEAQDDQEVKKEEKDLQ